MKRFDFYGSNAEAFNSKAPEILLAGPAGTGKSVVLMSKCLALLGKYPGCRILFARGTRTSLTQSGLVTWEEEVLGRDHPVLVRNPVKRRVRQSYEFSNGSEFVVCGLDDPGKSLSSQYNFVYIQEATEEGVTLDGYETLTRSLRNPGTPWSQIMMDCNPTSPFSWLYKRHLSGTLRLFSSKHKDNPRFWDRVNNRWTEDGDRYINGVLARMSGQRKKRFLLGEWAVAEGVVYEFKAEPEYDKETGEMIHPGHLLPADWEPPSEWIRVWGIDWGKTSPTVLGIWAVDQDGRMYLTREVYQTRLRPDELGKWAKKQIELGHENPPKAIVCDHDEERKVDFEKASGLQLELADKKDRDKGIEATQARFDVDDDGKPRIFFREDCRETLRGKEPDRFLVDAGRPTSCLEEIVGYTWDPDFLEDEPIAENDHSLDQMRYVARYVDEWYTPGARNDFYGGASRGRGSQLPAGTFR